MRAIHWFRNDLRLRDNTALAAAARAADELLPVFVLEPRLLSGEQAGAARSGFLLDCLERLGDDLRDADCPLAVLEGEARELIPRVAEALKVDRVYWNEDYSPFARARDAEVTRRLSRAGIERTTCKDRVVFDSSELRTGSGKPYSVYTPFRKAWYERLREASDVERRPPLPRLRARVPGPTVTKAELRKRGPDAGPEDLPTGGEDAARRRLDAFLDGPGRRYADGRNELAEDGTSRLSPYLRFGVISPRRCVSAAQDAARDAGSAARKSLHAWIDQLAWRDFYHAILAEHPHVLRHNHRREYDGMVWEDDAEGFEAWCEGRTGYPVVDAGMRQLAQTGWMHNRARMIVASFLTKDLLVDWREGERFFFRRLVDGDPANNNGGWQWAASTGTDAQPYFRIFNPTLQGQRYDPDGSYVRRWVPELEGIEGKAVHEPWKSPMLAKDYPERIVDHAERRELALERFQAARDQGSADG